MNTIVYARKGDLVMAEVTAKNTEKRYLLIVLETGQTSMIHESRLSGERASDRKVRFDGLEEGSEFLVRVLDAYQEGRHFNWRIEVSERAVTETVERREEEGESRQVVVLSEEALRQANQLRLSQRVVRGVVIGSAPEGGKMVQLNGFAGLLPAKAFNTKRPNPFTNGHTVRVKVDAVVEGQVIFTRAGIN